MAIGSAVQRGLYVYVYDENGVQTVSIYAGNQAGDGLHGYTSTSVSVKRGPYVYVYDEKGGHKQSIYAG